MSDIVAIWEVPLIEKFYKIELEHGTKSGKRIVRVNDKVVIKKDWVFKLVGVEQFEIGEEKKVKCEISITNHNGFTCQYNLRLNGEKLEDFKQKIQRKIVVWYCIISNQKIRIALDKDMLEVFVNGVKPKVESIFIDEGMEMKFNLINQDNEASIKVVSSGKKREGIIYNLFVNKKQIPESIE